MLWRSDGFYQKQKHGIVSIYSGLGQEKTKKKKKKQQI